jgi:hypothetical protein
MALVEFRPSIPLLETDISHPGELQAASQLATNQIGEHLDEFPLHLTGKLCWTKDTLAAKDYTWELTAEHKASVDLALQSFKGMTLAPLLLINTHRATLTAS